MDIVRAFVNCPAEIKIVYVYVIPPIYNQKIFFLLCILFGKAITPGKANMLL